MWWMVDVGFSHVDEDNLTQAQEKCLDLNIQATNIMYRSLHDCIFGGIIDMKTAHEIWSYLNEKYGTVSDAMMMMMSPRRRCMSVFSITTNR